MNLALTVLLAFIVMIAVIAAMGIGVMAGRKPIRGSCGGLNGAGCEFCSGTCRDRASARDDQSG